MRTRKGCNANAGKIAALASPAQNGRADRIDSRSWTSASGRLVGGKPFSRGALYLILPEPYLSRIRIAGNKAASSASRQTTLQQEIAVKNVAIADERGWLTAATPAKNPRHRLFRHF